METRMHLDDEEKRMERGVAVNFFEKHPYVKCVYRNTLGLPEYLVDVYIPTQTIFVGSEDPEEIKQDFRNARLTPPNIQ